MRRERQQPGLLVGPDLGDGTVGLLGVASLMGDVVPPAPELGVEVAEVAEGPGGEEGVAQVLDLPFDFPLLISASRRAGPETVPPTPWGDPDIGGYWTYVTITPLERPPGYEDRPVLPDDEARAFLAVGHRLIQAELDRQLNADGIVLGGLTNNRTSLVVDPADGRVPKLTAYGEARHRRLGFYARGIERGVDGAEDRERYERCIMGRTWPMVPTIEAQWLHVLQTPDHVAFVHEQNSDVRIVPLSADRPVNEAIRLWQGAPQGRWEGDTLVVTTTNLNGKWTLHGDGPNAVFVERIRRTDRDTLEYSVTVHDPEAYSAPWTIGFPIEGTTGPLYETACHEGNYSLELMLRGARAVERRAAGR